MTEARSSPRNGGTGGAGRRRRPRSSDEASAATPRTVDPDGRTASSGYTGTSDYSGGPVSTLASASDDQDTFESSRRSQRLDEVHRRAKGKYQTHREGRKARLMADDARGSSSGGPSSGEASSGDSWDDHYASRGSSIQESKSGRSKGRHSKKSKASSSKASTGEGPSWISGQMSVSNQSDHEKGSQSEAESQNRTWISGQLSVSKRSYHSNQYGEGSRSQARSYFDDGEDEDDDDEEDEWEEWTESSETLPDMTDKTIGNSSGCRTSVSSMTSVDSYIREQHYLHELKMRELEARRELRAEQRRRAVAMGEYFDEGTYGEEEGTVVLEDEGSYLGSMASGTYEGTKSTKSSGSGGRKGRPGADERTKNARSRSSRSGDRSSRSGSRSNSKSGRSGSRSNSKSNRSESRSRRSGSRSNSKSGRSGSRSRRSEGRSSQGSENHRTRSTRHTRSSRQSSHNRSRQSSRQSSHDGTYPQDAPVYQREECCIKHPSVLLAHQTDVDVWTCMRYTKDPESGRWHTIKMVCEACLEEEDADHGRDTDYHRRFRRDLRGFRGPGYRNLHAENVGFADDDYYYSDESTTDEDMTRSTSSPDQHNGRETVGVQPLEDQTPLEREAEAQRRRFVRRLAARAYHFPGNTWCEDWVQYTSNTHLVFGIFLHHPLHPVTSRERCVILLGSVAVGLMMSNIIYLWFVHYELRKDDVVMDLWGIDITKLMVTLWTLGSVAHTIFDLGVWHIKACTPCRYLSGGDVHIGDDAVRCGRKAGVTIVLMTLAFSSYLVLLRASEDYEASRAAALGEEGGLDDDGGDSFLHSVTLGGGAEHFDFLVGYIVEFFLAVFLYNPLILTIVFTGILGCNGKLPLLGGRPREVAREERYARKRQRYTMPRVLKLGDVEYEADEWGDGGRPATNF